MANLIIEVSNGLIAIITALVLYTVNRALKWVHDVDERLDRMEKELNKRK
jgi:hypothetical protein